MDPNLHLGKYSLGLLKRNYTKNSVHCQILHACMNLTTNEMFNYKRYPYLRDKRGRYLNPFSRGPVLNLFEFFVCLPDRLDEHDFILDDHL